MGYNWSDHPATGQIMPFSLLDRTTVAEQIAASIRDAILGGELPAGDALPSERELAGRFGVNRSSVREAVRRLEAWGLVKVRHGGGTLVNDVLATAGLQVLPFLIAPNGRLDGGLLRDLLDLRTALLGFTAQRAVERAGPGAADELAALVAALRAEADVGRAQVLDFDFFERLVQLSENRVLLLIANAVRRAYDENAHLFARLYVGGLDVRPHLTFVAALRAGDAEGARAAMERHGRNAQELVP